MIASSAKAKPPRATSARPTLYESDNFTLATVHLDERPGDQREKLLFAVVLIRRLRAPAGSGGDRQNRASHRWLDPTGRTIGNPPAANVLPRNELGSRAARRRRSNSAARSSRSPA